MQVSHQSSKPTKLNNLENFRKVSKTSKISQNFHHLVLKNSFLNMQRRRSLSMGSVASTYQYFTNGSQNKPLVMTFHSSTKWKAHLEASKQTNKMILIDFTASWCGPCKYMEPAIYEFAAKYTDVDFIKIDVDELEDVAAEYGVQAMPTFILLKNGKEVDKIVGARKEELLKKIEMHTIQV